MAGRKPFYLLQTTVQRMEIRAFTYCERSWLLQKYLVRSETKWASKWASDEVRVQGPFERLSGVGKCIERPIGAANKSSATATVPS